MGVTCAHLSHTPQCHTQNFFIQKILFSIQPVLIQYWAVWELVAQQMEVWCLLGDPCAGVGFTCFTNLDHGYEWVMNRQGGREGMGKRKQMSSYALYRLILLKCIATDELVIHLWLTYTSTMLRSTGITACMQFCILE